jgi:hypothetical protein
MDARLALSSSVVQKSLSVGGAQRVNIVSITVKTIQGREYCMESQQRDMARAGLSQNGHDC